MVCVTVVFFLKVEVSLREQWNHKYRDRTLKRKGQCFKSTNRRRRMSSRGQANFPLLIDFLSNPFSGHFFKLHFAVCLLSAKQWTKAKEWIKDEVWKGICISNGAGMARGVHGLWLSQNPVKRYSYFQPKNQRTIHPTWAETQPVNV